MGAASFFRGLPFIAVLAGLLLPMHASAAEPLRLYGERLVFDVLREGDKVGLHEVLFDRREGGVHVSARSIMKVEMLFLTLYRFDYRSEAFWRDGRLVELKAVTQDNGEESVVTAQWQPQGWRLSSMEEPFAEVTRLYPTNHWNAAVIGAEWVLNTITGDLSRVRIEEAGEETVEAEGREIFAKRYIYSGDLNSEVWYDEAGRWVGLRFLAEDGSRITFRCRLCLGPGRESAER